MKKVLLAIFTFLAIATSTSLYLVSCGGGGGGGGGGTVPTNPPGQATTIKFKTFSYVDQQGIGIEAFRMLVPSDWTFDGKIEWRFDNPGKPAVATFTVSDPNGKADLQLLPAQSFISSDDPFLLYYFPVGQKYYGNEVRHYPDSALQPIKTLEEIIIPRFRANVTSLQIVSEESLTTVAALLRAGIPSQQNTTVEAAKVRIEYVQNGTLMEEEIYCVVESAPLTISLNAHNILWVADYLFSFKAEKGGIDANYKLFQTMMYSFRLNPQWFNKYVQLIDYLVQQQIQIIQDWGKLSEYISKTSNDIDDMVWESYNSRNDANDRMAEDFTDYIRGTDTYYDPIDQNSIKLPSGYDDAWANSLGEYILSNDVNYDPNLGSGQNWQKMEIK